MAPSIANVPVGQAPLDLTHRRTAYGPVADVGKSSLLYALAASSPARHAFEPAWKIISRNHHDYNAGHDPDDAMRTLIRSNDAAQGMLAPSS